MERGKKSFTTSIERGVAEEFDKISLSLKKKPAVLIREFIIAIVEDRIRIIPKPDDKKYHRNLYT